jgi:hypothetical protein
MSVETRLSDLGLTLPSIPPRLPITFPSSGMAI